MKEKIIEPLIFFNTIYIIVFTRTDHYLLVHISIVYQIKEKEKES